jgi:hypothetical protein
MEQIAFADYLFRTGILSGKRAQNGRLFDLQRSFVSVALVI